MHSGLSRKTILLTEQVAVQSLAGRVARLNGINVCNDIILHHQVYIPCCNCGHVVLQSGLV